MASFLGRLVVCTCHAGYTVTGTHISHLSSIGQVLKHTCCTVGTQPALHNLLGAPQPARLTTPKPANPFVRRGPHQRNPSGWEEDTGDKPERATLHSCRSGRRDSQQPCLWSLSRVGEATASPQTLIMLQACQSGRCASTSLASSIFIMVSSGGSLTRLGTVSFHG